MKHTYRRMIPVLCLLALAACQSPESRVRTVAETFLNAYYTADYAAAADCCTPAFAELVARGADETAAVPEETAQKIKEALSGTSFEIVSVELDEDAASALVRYELGVPGLESPLPKSLKLQLEGRTALVDGIE